MGCASQRLRLHTRMPGCRQARRFMQVGVNSGSSRPHPPTHPPTHPHSHTHKHKTHTCSRWHAKVLHPPAFCIAHACLHTRAAESPSSRPRADGRHPSRLSPGRNRRPVQPPAGSRRRGAMEPTALSAGPGLAIGVSIRVGRWAPGSGSVSHETQSRASPGRPVRRDASALTRGRPSHESAGRPRHPAQAPGGPCREAP